MKKWAISLAHTGLQVVQPMHSLRTEVGMRNPESLYPPTATHVEEGIATLWGVAQCAVRR
jgi:hypothetical protein